MSEPESRNGGSGTPAAPEISRRRALERLSVAAGAVGAGIVALPAAGFVVAPLLEKVPEAWRPVGRPDEFKVGETASGWGNRPYGRLAATGRCRALRRLRHQLHPFGLPRPMA